MRHTPERHSRCSTAGHPVSHRVLPDCTSAPLQESLHAELVEAVAARMRSLTVGDGTDAATQMGPCINGARVEHAAAHVADAVDRGARVVCGGSPPAGLDRGYFFAPTLLDAVTPGMRVWREETFAPVIPVRTCAPCSPASGPIASNRSAYLGLISARQL